MTKLHDAGGVKAKRRSKRKFLPLTKLKDKAQMS
jgi:hypothetical protein